MPPPPGGASQQLHLGTLRCRREEASTPSSKALTVSDCTASPPAAAPLKPMPTKRAIPRLLVFGLSALSLGIVLTALSAANMLSDLTDRVGPFLELVDSRRIR